jgi:sporulation protein YlmC with PRC-barrel domain
MPAPSVEEVRAWLGRVMVDRDGNRLGEITDIYLDRETDRPEWAVVRTGLFGLRSSFVPLAEASEAGDQIQVPHPRTLVKDAPNIEADGQLSEAEEAELYRHYGLDYETETANSDQAASQQLGDPAAGQPSGPAGDEQPTTPPPGSSEPATAPIGGPVERRSGEELQATDPMGSAQPATDDGLAVGEGVSRPFVYETPSPPQDRPSSRRRQPGQVRLRRYLVTEVVTETESGQRHELQVEREPIDDPAVTGMTAPASQSGEAVAPAPAEPDANDWFRPEGDPPR